MNPGLPASSCLFACPYRTFLGILPLGFLEAAYEVRGTHKWKNPIFFFFLAGGGDIFPYMAKMGPNWPKPGFCHYCLEEAMWNERFYNCHFGSQLRPKSSIHSSLSLKRYSWYPRFFARRYSQQKVSNWDYYIWFLTKVTFPWQIHGISIDRPKNLLPNALQDSLIIDILGESQYWGLCWVGISFFAYI